VSGAGEGTSAACGAAPVIEGGFAEVQPGVRLHYARCGDASKPLMLMLHGFPEFWGAWRHLMPAFADAYHVVAPDLRGYNLSDKPAAVADYRPSKLIADVAGLVRALGHERCVLVAHDWGGAIAWSVAIAHPELIERLVILNAPHPVPFAKALASDPAQIRASQYMNWLRRPGSETVLAQDGFARLESFFLNLGGEAWFDAATRHAYHSAWSQPGALAGGVNWYRASPLHPATESEPGASGLSLDAQAFTVRVPTLVIWGERDTALLPVLLDGLDALVPDLRIVRLPEATHWLAHEQPERVVAEIRAFLGLRPEGRDAA
jgi:pimeloyl-ACP methyl ester carboxylesterase